MSSIIGGYNYDIFISYRQKDNKHDGWVTEFVDKLKGELESTFKEEVSIYFDFNPQDGLLETHDVEESLKEKLKCLIFIPIVSRTYCDSKSFAWEHEFKAFVEQASHDQFGLKIKLPNGNVAGRVLPVRIHELDADDEKLCETVLGGVLRGIDFIYKEPGVNKPLTTDDDHKKNLNNTKYSIQINKTANALNEIIRSMQNAYDRSAKDETHGELPSQEMPLRMKEKTRPPGSKVQKLVSEGIFIMILISLAVLTFTKIFKKDKKEKALSADGRVTIAVMPFQNMTNDTLWNIWQEGIQNLLISSLSNSEELKVRQTETVNDLLQSNGLTTYASMTPAVASGISQKLDVNVMIYGSVNQAGTTIRLNAQLIDPKTEVPFNSFQIDGPSENILKIVDSLSGMVKNVLIITRLGKISSTDESHSLITYFPEAYKHYIIGENAFKQYDYLAAIQSYSRALEIDTNFTLAEKKIALTYYNMEMYDEAKEYCLRIYSKRDQVSLQEQIFINWIHALLYETPYEEIKYIKQLQKFDEQTLRLYSVLGHIYLRLYQYDNALAEFHRIFEINKKQNSKLVLAQNYAALGYAYHKTGQYKKERRLYREVAKEFPDDFDLIYLRAVLSLAEGDTIEANQYIEKVKIMCRENSYPDAVIKSILADLFSEGGDLDKAEEYYRQSCEADPEDFLRMNSLAYFLIDKNRNTDEGIQLVNKALELKPGNYSLLHTKGWGLYKQGKFRDALDFLEQSWKLKPVYNHDIYLHLEEVKSGLKYQTSV